MEGFGIKDIIDILLVAFLMYQTYKLMRETGTVKIFIGIMTFITIWFLVEYVFDYSTMTFDAFAQGKQFEFDARAERERIYTVLSDRSIPYTERLTALYNRYDASPALLSDIEWRNVIDSLEFLDGSHKELFLKFTSDTSVAKEIEPFLERTLAYFVFRHCSHACDNADFLARLGFCLFCERLMASIINAEDVKQLHDTIRLSRIISEEIEYSEDNTESIVWEFGFKQSLNAID